MQTRGVIGHYLFVSAKSQAGIEELRTAIFDCDIDNGNKELEPSAKMDPIKKVTKQKRKSERRKLKKHIADKGRSANMAQTFTAGFGAPRDLLPEDLDVMMDGAISEEEDEDDDDEAIEEVEYDEEDDGAV